MLKSQGQSQDESFWAVPGPKMAETGIQNMVSTTQLVLFQHSLSRPRRISESTSHLQLSLAHITPHLLKYAGFCLQLVALPTEDMVFIGGKLHFFFFPVFSLFNLGHGEFGPLVILSLQLGKHSRVCKQLFLVKQEDGTQQISKYQ